MKKRLLWLPLVAMLLGGCGRESVPKVHVSLWCNEQQKGMVEEALKKFAEEHSYEVELQYTVSVEGEDTCKDAILRNRTGAADMFFFADDQVKTLVREGALLEITMNKGAILEAAGGAESGAAEAIMVDGKMYAYPVSAGNGYFLYYNKAYFQPQDVKQIDSILEVARKNLKKFTVDYSSGWYLYGFFEGAGLDMEADATGTRNICNWNATNTRYKGVDVAESLLDIATDKGFASRDDAGFVEGVANGSIIAGINGAWNAESVRAVWKDDFGAVMLPTFTCDGDQVQMESFMGYKVLGINSATAYPAWCMRLAEYLTNEENQLARFREVGECPANVNAANNEEVQAAPVVAALTQQSAYASRQNVAEPFWNAASMFGITLAGGNRSGMDLQELLDDMVREITADTSVN